MLSSSRLARPQHVLPAFLEQPQDPLVFGVLVPGFRIYAPPRSTGPRIPWCSGFLTQIGWFAFRDLWWNSEPRSMFTSFFDLNPVISVTSFLKTKRRALSKGLSLNETFEIGFRV